MGQSGTVNFIDTMQTLVLAVVITTFMGIGVYSKPNPLNEAVGIHNTMEDSNGSLGRGKSQGDNKGNIVDDKREEEALLEELGYKLGQWFAATINNHDSSDNSLDADAGYRDEPISRLVHSLAKRSLILNTIEESNLSLGRGKSQGKTGDNKGNILDDKREEEAILQELGYKLGQWFAAAINNHDSSDNSVDGLSGHRDEPISHLVHSLAKRSPILNPFFPIKVPAAIIGSGILGGVVGSNPLTWPLIPAVLMKAAVAGFLAMG